MIKRFFEWLGEVLTSIWSAFVSAIGTFCGWLWEALQAWFGWISESITNWTLSLIIFIIEHLPGVTFDQSANVIDTIRDYLEAWNNILPISTLITCVGLYLGAYLAALSIKTCIFVYDKVAAIVP